MTWEITSSPSDNDESVVSNGVFDHGRRLASDGKAQALACFFRVDGKVVAGGVGRTEYGRLFITSVWVRIHLVYTSSYTSSAVQVFILQGQVE